MSIITLPDAVIRTVGDQSFGQDRFDLEDRSDVTGAAFTNLMGPPRWTTSLVQPRFLRPEEAGEWIAMRLRLRGGVNHLAVFDTQRQVPMGTARGTGLTTTANAALGATSVAITGARSGVNLLRYSGFELDSNADGLSDGLSQEISGSTGTVTYSRPARDIGGVTQRFSCTLGTSTADRAGVAFAPVPLPAGQVVTLSADVICTPGVTMVLFLSNGVTGVETVLTPGFTWQRMVLSHTMATAGSMVCGIWMRAGTGGTVAGEADRVQLELGGSSTAYAGLPTLVTGDWVQLGTGVGSHLCAITSAVTLNDAGAGTITFEPPLRKALASGSAVTIERALGHYKLSGQPGPWRAQAGGPHIEGLALDLREDWTP